MNSADYRSHHSLFSSTSELLRLVWLDTAHSSTSAAFCCHDHLFPWYLLFKISTAGGGHVAFFAVCGLFHLLTYVVADNRIVFLFVVEQYLLVFLHRLVTHWLVDWLVVFTACPLRMVSPRWDFGCLFRMRSDFSFEYVCRVRITGSCCPSVTCFYDDCTNSYLPAVCGMCFSPCSHQHSLCSAFLTEAMLTEVRWSLSELLTWISWWLMLLRHFLYVRLPFVCLPLRSVCLCVLPISFLLPFW